MNPQYLCPSARILPLPVSSQSKPPWNCLSLPEDGCAVGRLNPLLGENPDAQSIFVDYEHTEKNFFLITTPSRSPAPFQTAVIQITLHSDELKAGSSVIVHKQVSQLSGSHYQHLCEAVIFKYPQGLKMLMAPLSLFL